MPYRIVRAVLLILVSASGLGCQTPENAMRSRLSKLLETNGYTLYTPFRTSDYPATLFVLSKNHEGRSSEFTLATYTETFDVDASTLFNPEGQKVGFTDDLKDDFSFGGSVGVELASIVVKPELAGKYASQVTMTFGEPKLTHQISFKKLDELKSHLSEHTKAVLRDFKQRQQLNHVYLVLQTLRVSSLKLDMTLKQEFSGKVSVEQLKQIAKGNAEVKLESNGHVSLTTKEPMIIGYKAVSFPESLLRTEVSPPDISNLTLVAPEELRAVKEK